MAIPDPDLRQAALHTLDEKWGHAEGAAAFAVLVAREDRLAFARMVIAYELMIDYIDTISEQPVADPWANTLQLHRAATNAVACRPAGEPDYYMFHPRRADGGFLTELAETVREPYLALPSCAQVAERVELFASLYAEGQAGCHAEQARAAAGPATGIDAMASRYGELSWDEVRAACTTPIPLYALMALATRTECSAADVESWCSAYFPWPACLHILLHSLADEEDDRAVGAFNQFAHYQSRREACGALASIALRAREGFARLPQVDAHTTIHGGMVGYYLASPGVWTEPNRHISELVLKLSGPSARWGMLTHRRRLEGGGAGAPASTPYPTATS